MGVKGNCSSISHGGEVDSTGLRTQTADITPRTRCVPPEALKNAATAKKSAEMGSRQAPRFGFYPGEANLPIAGLRDAIQENGVPGTYRHAILRPSRSDGLTVRQSFSGKSSGTPVGL